MLTNLINQHCSDLTDPAEMADRLNEKNIKISQPKVGTKEVLETLGEDSESVFAAFESTAVGRRGLQILSDQSSDGGLDFSDPLVVAQFDVMLNSGAITTDVYDKLVALGVTYVSLAEQAGFGVLTVEQIEDALTVPTETGFETLISLNKSPDGEVRAIIRKTECGLKDGRVIFRGESEIITSGPVIDMLIGVINNV